MDAMTQIGNANNGLLQSQLDAIQLREKIAYKVAAKQLDASRMEGDMVLSLLDEAAQMADEMQAQSADAPASPLGQNLDVHA
jgi:hypothetical protein